MWKIVYKNDVGPADEYFVEWWDVVEESSGKSFRANTVPDAEMLANALNEKYYPMERN